MMSSEEQLVIGAAGGEYLKDLLGQSKNPPETISQFQRTYGLHSHVRCQPALKMLDLLGISRAHVCSSLLEHLSKILLKRIEVLDEEQLQKLLIRTFPFIEFPELRSLTVKIMSKQQNTPKIFLEKIATNQDILSELPLHVKRRIWLVNVFEFRKTIQSIFEEYVVDKSRFRTMGWDLTSEHLIAPDKRRRQDRSLRNLLRVIGGNADLYNSTVEYIRESLKTANSVTFPCLCTLRADILNGQRDLTASSMRDDPLHKLAWYLDTVIKHNDIDVDRLREIQMLIQSYRVGDIVLSTSNEMAEDENEDFEILPALSLAEVITESLDKLDKLDSRKIFAQPVSETEVVGYRDIIQHPMDLSTMRKRLLKGKYKKMSKFKDEFQLMIDNCMTFNPADTIYYKHAEKLMQRGSDAIAKCELRLKPQKVPKPKANKKRRVSKDAANGGHDPSRYHVIQDGVYHPLLVDIAIFISDPYAYNLLLRMAIKCLNECIMKQQLPFDHPHLRGYVQLLHLGHPKTILKMIKKQCFHIVQPNLSALREFLPLVCLIKLGGKKTLDSILLEDPIWKDSLNRSNLCTKILMCILVDLVKNGSQADLVKQVLSLFSSPVRLVDDRSFVQSLVSAIAFHKSSLTPSLRTVIVDEFLLKQLENDDCKKGNNVLHLQFARLLWEWSCNAKMTVNDLTAYAKASLAHLGSEENLSTIWEEPWFKYHRFFYEKLFSKQPSIRVHLGLPAVEEQEIALSTTTADPKNNGITTTSPIASVAHLGEKQQQQQQPKV